MELIRQLGLHFITGIENLASILHFGLLSRTEILARGLGFNDISDLEVQTLRARPEPVFGRSIHDYVPLYLNPKNAMLSLRRAQQDRLLILRISIDDVIGPRAIFTDGNAANSTTEFSLNPAIVAKARPALIADYWTDIPDGKRRRMAEVLVPERIAPEAIERAICSNRTLAHRIREEHDLYAATDPMKFF